MGLVGQLLRSLRARLHSGCGWLAYRLRLPDLARRHYERVLVLRGSDFTAYVQLGRIAFAAGDYAGWRREFEHARRTDPDRFARLRHPFELFEPRLAGTDFDDTGDRATWRSLLPFGSGGARRPQAPRAETPFDGAFDAMLPGWDVRADAVTDAAAPQAGGTTPSDRDADRDDCASAAERERLAALGPIRRDDVTACDLDELARRLSG
ncbi:MAG: hypothetical protein JNL08_19585 [Planctomycetes bacterium]|nr:hypothetical protein [Planctomycetota bacterium]